MKKLIGTAIVAIVAAFSVPAFAETDAECSARFDKADANNDGYVMRAENPAYFAALEKAGMMSVDANKDGKLNADEFHEACVKGVFKDIK